MKQQVVIIHGGTSFESYDEYLSYLKNREVCIDNFRRRGDWKGGLEKELGDGFKVLSPSMPNKTNARYEEWKIWLERLVPLLEDGAIFIGHSMGGIFLTKYFSESKSLKKVQAAVLVASPFDEESGGESLAEFALPRSLEKFAAQVPEIYLVYSKDDPVVSFGEMGKYKRALPDAKTLIFSDRQHFNQESFPEIVDLIKKISS